MAQALLANIRLGWKDLSVTNTLAYKGISFPDLILQNFFVCHLNQDCCKTLLGLFHRRYDTKHNDIQPNDTQHNDIRHNDIQHNIYVIATLCLMTLSIMALNTVMLNVYAECHLMMSVVTSPIMLCVIKLNVVMLSVVAPFHPVDGDTSHKYKLLHF